MRFGIREAILAHGREIRAQVALGIARTAQAMFCTSGIDHHVVVWRPGDARQDLAAPWIQEALEKNDTMR